MIATMPPSAFLIGSFSMSMESRDALTIDRRRCLQLGALGAAALPMSRVLGAPADGAATAAGERKRVLRFAHLTDLHIQPELEAARGVAACLQHVQAGADPAKLVITGGDTVFDVFEVDASRTDLLVKLWRDSLAAECSLPVRSVIGNHDVRPWTDSDIVGGDGKAWAADFLHLERRYYGFDQAGWRFLVLDTVQPDAESYAGFLDPEQMAWLQSELTNLAGARPVAIISHIPILSLTPLTGIADHVVDGDHVLSDAYMMRDGTAIHYLLREHANVKLCLSGHMHLCDRCEIDGITYICGGAVCANWWKGIRQKVHEGYGLVDLYDDGSFNYAYTRYGWSAVPA
jgi:Icc protein